MTSLFDTRLAESNVSRNFNSKGHFAHIKVTPEKFDPKKNFEILITIFESYMDGVDKTQWRNYLLTFLDEKCLNGIISVSAKSYSELIEAQEIC